MRLKTTKINELLGIFLFVIIPFLVKSQCPVISTTVSIPNCGSSGCNLCTGDSVRINMTGTNFPTGTMLDWYISPNSGFNPYNSEGEYIGSSPVNTNNAACVYCPKLLGILVNACNPPGNEQDNEFLMLSSGSGFNTNNLQVDYDANNNSGGGSNNDVNIFAGPGVDVPAGAIVVFFSSSQTASNYDFSSICNISTSVYVMQSGCARGIGAFTDYASGSSIRTTKISLSNCMCQDILSYDRGSPGLNTGNGANTVKDPVTNLVSYGNNGCAPPIVTNPSINLNSTSSFKFVADCNSPAISGSGTYYIKALINPLDPACTEITTTEIKVNISCPEINPAGPLEVCIDQLTGLATFHLDDLNATITGGVPGATVIWKLLNGTIISPPHIIISATNTTVKATVSINGCKSNEILIDLKPLQLPVTGPDFPAWACRDPFGGPTASANIDLTTLETSIIGGNPYTVTWYESNTSFILIPNPSNYFFNVSHYVNAVVSDGICEKRVIVLLIPRDAPNVTVSPAGASFCEANSVALTATGSGGSGSNYSFSWLTPSGNINANSIVASVAGSYFVTVTDGEGCTNSTSVIVGENPKPIVVINPDPANFCIGSTLELNALVSSGTPPYISYQWTTPTGPKTGQIINVNTSGNYSVTVTDNLGCTGVTSIVVGNFISPMVTIDPLSPSICNGGTVNLNAMGSGGSGNYTYNWTTPSGNNTGNPITVSESGIYTVTVSDANGCKANTGTTVNVSPEIINE